jgi:hypothetical protein
MRSLDLDGNGQDNATGGEMTSDAIAVRHAAPSGRPSGSSREFGARAAGDGWVSFPDRWNRRLRQSAPTLGSRGTGCTYWVGALADELSSEPARARSERRCLAAAGRHETAWAF